MTLTESSIYISLKRLRRLLYSAQFGMTNGNRIVYGSPIMENIGKAISSYVLAFTVMEKKLEYIDEWAIGMGIKYERFVDDMYFIVNNKSFLLCIPELRTLLSKLGASLSEHKFYCQHYTKGVECLGVHIKLGRVYVNNRIVRRGIWKAAKLNRNIKPGMVFSMLSSINSYIGFCKNTNGYNQIRKILSKLSPKWKEYVYFNKEKVCLSARADYTKRNQIINKYNLYDTAGKRRKSAAPHRTDGSCEG